MFLFSLLFELGVCVCGGGGGGEEGEGKGRSCRDVEQVNLPNTHCP